MRPLILALAALVVVCPQTVASAGNDTAVPQHDLLTLSDGLSDSTVYSIDQDALGRIWFGTASGGANVYDGHGIRSLVNSARPDSLSHSGAGQVLVRRDGSIYVGTWGGGLNRLASPDGGFERFNPTTAPLQIQILFEDSAARLWVGSSGDGLFLFDTERGHLPVQRDDGRALERIWSLAESDDGRLWVAAQAGLFELEPGSLRARLISDLAGDPPRALAAIGRTLWIGRSTEIWSLDLDALTLREERSGLPLVNVLRGTDDGRLLVGTLAGLCAVDATTRESTAPVPGGPERLFQDRNIRAIDFDRTGMIWLATREAGVIRLSSRPSGFDGHSTRGQLESVDTLAELPSGALLLGSRRGLWQLEEDHESLRPVAGSEGLSVNQLIRHDDRIYVATRSGLRIYEEDSGRLLRDRTFDAVEGLSITVGYVAPDESLWLGTWEAGLYHLPADGSPATHYHSGGQPSLPDDTVSAIEPDAQGGLWLGHWWEGLSRLDPERGTIEHFPSSPEELGALPHGHVHGVLVQPDRVWVGTSFGFASLDVASREVTRVPVTREDLPTSVQRLAGDARGDIWIATSRGIKRFSPASGQLLHFGRADGLNTTEFYARSGDVGAEGKIYFGGVGGLVGFQPSTVQTQFEQPSVFVTGVEVDGAALPFGSGRVEVPPGSRELVLDFAAADFKDPDQNRYQHRLRGDRDAWSAASSERSISFAALPHGEYTFEVRAANSNGIWSLDAPARLEVAVLPFWWQTTAGRLGIGLLVLSMIWLWQRMHTARIRADNRRLEAEVTRQTEDLQRANRRLATAAQTDFLTGLPNRRGFYAEVATRAGRLKGAVALADVDNFKMLNDRHGHELGDEALREIAGAIASVLRPEDLAARWGGEEFILLFSEVGVEEATAIAERVRQTVATLQLPGRADLEPFSITVGLAELTGRDQLERAIGRADEMLYRGKQAGKNQVVRAA